MISVSDERKLDEINLTFIGIIEIHGVQTNYSHFIRNNFNSVVGSALKDLEIVEWYEGTPYPY